MSFNRNQPIPTTNRAEVIRAGGLKAILAMTELARISKYREEKRRGRIRPMIERVNAVRRRLFVDGPPDKNVENDYLDDKLKDISEEKSAKWEFNFENGKPLVADNNDQRRFKWQTIEKENEGVKAIDKEKSFKQPAITDFFVSKAKIQEEEPKLKKMKIAENVAPEPNTKAN